MTLDALRIAVIFFFAASAALGAWLLRDTRRRRARLQEMRAHLLHRIEQGSGLG